MSTITIILHPKDGLDGELEMRKLLLEHNYDHKEEYWFPYMPRGGIGKVITGKYAGQMMYYASRVATASVHNRFENAIMRKTITPLKIQLQVVGDDRDDVSKFFPMYPGMADNFFSVDIPSMTRRSSAEKMRVGRMLSNALRVMCKFVPGGNRYNLYVVSNGILYKIQKGHMYRTVKNNNRNQDVSLTATAISAADTALSFGTRAYKFISGSPPVNTPASTPLVETLFERYINEGRKAHETSSKHSDIMARRLERRYKASCRTVVYVNEQTGKVVNQIYIHSIGVNGEALLKTNADKILSLKGGHLTPAKLIKKIIA
jgi:hypothetical protein